MESRRVGAGPGKHIGHGYAVGTGQHVSADRVLVASQSVDSTMLAGIFASAKDLAVYTSNDSSVQKQLPSAQQQNQDYGLGLSL